MGGATGQLSIIVADRHPHMTCTSFDLPVVEPIAARTIEAAGLSERVKAVGGDFFADPLPKADVITMGLILHDWNLEKRSIWSRPPTTRCRRVALSSRSRTSSMTPAAKTRSGC